MKPSSPAGSPPTPDLMPGIDEILDYFAGAILLMAGRSAGLKRFDLSPDGFWQSFSAIVVALPPMALAWVEYETVERQTPEPDTGVLVVYGAHALADAIAWVLPVLVLMMIARRIGYSRKIVPLVVATNWGGALLSWAFAPYWLIVFVFGVGPGTSFLGILVTLASIGLTVRLVYMAIGKDLGGAVAVTTLMIVCSLMSYAAVMDVTGVALV